MFKIFLKGAYWIIQRFLVHYQILYLEKEKSPILHHNIGLFSFASYEVIALSTIATVLTLKGDSQEER